MRMGLREAASRGAIEFVVRALERTAAIDEAGVGGVQHEGEDGAVAMPHLQAAAAGADDFERRGGGRKNGLESRYARDARAKVHAHARLLQLLMDRYRNCEGTAEVPG